MRLLGSPRFAQAREIPVTFGPCLARAAAAALAVAAATIEPAMAHPHIWVEVQSGLHVDQAGRIDAVEQAWRFDQDYSDFALAGLDTNRDGRFSAKELAPLRAEMAESLPASHYLTTFSVDGLARNLKPASSLEVAVEQGRLAVHLTLPVEEPVDPRAHEVTLATYDETYYVAFDLARDQPARLTGEVPTGCRTVIEPPRGARDQVMLSDKLAFNLDLARSFALDFTSTIAVRCAP